MGETSTTPASMMWDFLRGVFSVFDLVAYGLLYYVYQIFFNVTSADLFSNETVMKFYGRVQLIIGVFMMFQLAMTVLKGIMDPDSFTNAKSGAGNVIMRIATALVLLTVLVPINIPSPRNEYEIQLNNNGLLFGTLYSLQHRILSNNTLGRLILGTDNSSSYSASSDDLKTASRIFTSTILKGFYRINLKPENERPKHEDGKDDSVFNDNRMCTDIDDDILDTYTRIDANYSDIIGMYKYTCEVDDDNLSLFEKVIAVASPKYAGKERYVFTMMPFISAVVGFIFVFILVSFSIDVAIRAVKLVILRLIAPIPIIMYMNPKGTQDNAFNTWVKTLTSTYLDLFIRLATVYFVIFLVQDMMINGVVMDVGGSGVVSLFTHIIIWIGLFVFAKQAPKFIRQVLGIKDEGGKLFGGLGEIGAAAGLAAALPGAIGSGIASASASRSADKTRAAFGEKDIFGREINPDSFLNKGKHLLSGIVGGVAGGVTGVRAAATAKDHGFNASIEAMRKRNDAAIQRGNSGSTLLGRTESSFKSIFTGEGSSGPTSRKIESAKSQKSALDAIKSRMSGEMVKKDWTFGEIGRGIKDTTGHELRDNNGNVLKFNYKDFMARYTAAQSSNATEFEIVDSYGHSHTISTYVAERQKGQLLKTNEDDYIRNAINSSVRLDTGAVVSEGVYDSELVDLIKDATAKGATVTDRNSVTANGSERLGQEIRRLERENVINKANDQYSGKK